MKLPPYRDMDAIRPLSFNEALSALHAILGSEVKVAMNEQTRFLGCGFEGTLDRVETLPPDNAAIRIVLRGGNGLFFDPAETEAFACGDLSPRSTCLEFRCGSCIVTLESV